MWNTGYVLGWLAAFYEQEDGRVVLPMGRGRASLVLPLALPENSSVVHSCGTMAMNCMRVETPQAE